MSYATQCWETVVQILHRWLLLMLFLSATFVSRTWTLQSMKESLSKTLKKCFKLHLCLFLRSWHLCVLPCICEVVVLVLQWTNLFILFICSSVHWTAYNMSLCLSLVLCLWGGPSSVLLCCWDFIMKSQNLIINLLSKHLIIHFVFQTRTQQETP